jgi:hypothetical protein
LASAFFYFAIKPEANINPDNSHGGSIAAERNGTYRLTADFAD